MGNRLGPNKTIDIGRWSICVGGRLEKFYCICIYIYIYSWLLKFYILATFMVISRVVNTCDSVHKWWLCCPIGKSYCWYLTQSHYPDNELTCPSLILWMLNTSTESDKYQFCKSFAWLWLGTELSISRKRGLSSANWATTPGICIYCKSLHWPFRQGST